jgi:hypothetical protein
LKIILIIFVPIILVDIQYASRPFSKEEKEELFDLNTKSNNEVPLINQSTGIK